MTEETMQDVEIKQWNQIYEDYLLKTAMTAEVVCNWNLLRELLRFKIKQLCEQKLSDNPSNQIINGESIEDFQMRIWSILDSFDEPPFTVQRLCELATINQEQHKTVWKYLRAIEKVLLVTSCVSSNDKDLSMDLISHSDSNIKTKNLIDPLKVKIENPDLDTIFENNNKAPSSLPNDNSDGIKDTPMTYETTTETKKDNKMEINDNESDNNNDNTKINENNDKNTTNSNDMDIFQ
ncbi:PPP4R2-domain-containing protein [Piromyces finnis]|uniref:PPP4R2-domain-containing protein n=1 Tax=Piromyces finnis TaxID=1754191 RepID=A0A1Y1V374_9FUNG|nr:PPP4R2-domain-containing protein [Piromyces finnis]|eukprot:ORX46232.1 PPP4R2-domain-containing protein [Piromyces finnis]